MIKLYFLIAIIYGLIKMLNSYEVDFFGRAGVFVANSLLFPLSAIKDFVNWLTTDIKVKEMDEPCKKERER